MNTCLPDLLGTLCEQKEAVPNAKSEMFQFCGLTKRPECRAWPLGRPCARVADTQPTSHSSLDL